MSKIRLHGSSSGYTDIAPASAAGSATVTLPTSAGEILLSDGSAASLTQIPAANIVGVCTSGLTKTGGFGKVLQAVSATTTTTTSNTTTTYADTGLTATISISAGSKVLVMCVQHLDIERNSTGSRCAVKLLRGSTDIFAPGNSKSIGIEGYYGSVQKVLFLPLHLSFLDTGASTGSNTYKLQARVTVASDSSRVRFQDDSNPSTMTLLEIAS